jgi:hypothetical protein
MYFDPDVVKAFLPKDDEGFTRWWMKISLLTGLATVILPCMEIWVNFLKGVTAGSGLCVFVSYYIFAVIHNIYHSPNLMKHMYHVQKLEKYMTYEVYIGFDIGVHAVCTICLYLVWYEYITVLTTLAAFLLHRYWSVLNSNGTTIYMCGDDIYLNKPLPYWGWPAVYIGEATMLVFSLLISIWLQRT